jgi:uncharacterized DUF497 family protein
VTAEVYDLEWDEVGEEHVAKHGLTVREVNQIIANPHVVVRNRKGRRADYLMIGSTHGGEIVTAALEKTRGAGTWRVATAYPATDAQQQVFKREVR